MVFYQPPMLTNRFKHCSITFTDIVYVFGGYNEAKIKHCEKFTNGKWDAISDMHKEAHDLGCAAYGHKIYVAGDGSTYFEEYDPHTDEFNLLGIKTIGKGSYTSMVCVGESILVFSNKVLNRLDVRNESMEKIADLPPEGDWRCPFIPVLDGDSVYLLHGGKVLYKYNWKSGELEKLIANFS
jgi:hypothetical protein